MEKLVSVYACQATKGQEKAKLKKLGEELPSKLKEESILGTVPTHIEDIVGYVSAINLTESLILDNINTIPIIKIKYWKEKANVLRIQLLEVLVYFKTNPGQTIGCESEANGKFWIKLTVTNNDNKKAHVDFEKLNPYPGNKEVFAVINNMPEIKMILDEQNKEADKSIRDMTGELDNEIPKVGTRIEYNS